MTWNILGLAVNLFALLASIALTRAATNNEDGGVEGQFLDQRSCRDGRVLIPLADVSITDAYKSGIRRDEAKFLKQEKLMSKNCESKRCTYDWTGKLNDFVCIPEGSCAICFGEPGTLVRDNVTAGAVTVGGVKYPGILICLIHLILNTFWDTNTSFYTAIKSEL